MEKEAEIKKALRSLCLSYGWSFGVFWSFDQRNTMLLTLEDAFSEDYARSLTDNMLLQVHILGEGVIGQAALDGKHRWVKCSYPGHAQIQQDNCEFSSEFSSGIKTMAVIPVESCGVLQFGSVHEMLETPSFLDQARQIFRELGFIHGLVPFGHNISSCSMMPSYNSLQSTHLQASDFGHNVSSCTDPISTTNDSFPSSSYSSGFDPLSYLGGSVDNYCLDSLLQGPSNLQGFDEFNSTEFPTSLLQEHHMDDLLQSLLPHSNPDEFSHGFETHIGNVKREETLEDILFTPSEAIVGSSMVGPKKGLFSELGLDQLLINRADSSSFAKSSIEDPIHSPKRRKMEECFQESGKCFTSDAKSCVTDHNMRTQESSKATKKRARPGESTRPRPKDRQMIQDRIKELRDIIPNGAKCSIDSLLDRTIKHMLFMQGVTKYVNKLKRVEEAKAQRDLSNNRTSSSTAWAVDVGGHNPVVVEELGNSGQMLIEMVCEEQGFFLEIADVIRGFGLTILKGLVEARDGKIWAQFIVEANRHVTRMEVLMSLLQLFKESSSTVGSKSVAEGNKVVENKTSSLLNTYHLHQPMMSLPVQF